MKGTLDNFVIMKRKTVEEPEKQNNPENKSENTPEKPPEKKTKLPPKIIEKIPEKTSLISNKNIKKTAPQIEKFYPTYESFIDKLQTWKIPLKNFINPPNNKQMLSIYNFVKKEYLTKTIFPPKNLIFNAFEKTPFDKIKIVIIGQDPYPNPGDAMGLSFSVPKNQKIPGSLNNIYKCLEKDKKINFIRPKNGDLTNWANEGVFLLNATLTVECKKPNSHQKNSGWGKFTDFVIKEISNQKKNVVFLLWGNFAIAKSKLIDNKKHLIITNIHPSPLAQTKGDFTKSEQFSQANEYLEKNGIKGVNWELK